MFAHSRAISSRCLTVPRRPVLEGASSSMVSYLAQITSKCAMLLPLVLTHIFKVAQDSMRTESTSHHREGARTVRDSEK